MLYLSLVDKYSFIVDGTADNEIDAFIAQKDKVFEDYVDVNIKNFCYNG
jgi:hypothetical protein